MARRHPNGLLLRLLGKLLGKGGAQEPAYFSQPGNLGWKESPSEKVRLFFDVFYDICSPGDKITDLGMLHDRVAQGNLQATTTGMGFLMPLELFLEGVSDSDFVCDANQSPGHW